MTERDNPSTQIPDDASHVPPIEAARDQDTSELTPPIDKQRGDQTVGGDVPLDRLRPIGNEVGLAGPAALTDPQLEETVERMG